MLATIYVNMYTPNYIFFCILSSFLHVNAVRTLTYIEIHTLFWIYQSKIVENADDEM